MQRRELLKSLAALPLMRIGAGNQKVDAVELENGKHFLIVADPNATDADKLCGLGVPNDHPLSGAYIVWVTPRPGHTIQDEFAIYELGDKNEKTA